MFHPFLGYFSFHRCVIARDIEGFDLTKSEKMRIFHISLFSLLFAVGSVSGGWIDIQGEDDALLNEPIFASVSDLDAFDRANEGRIERESLDWTNGLPAARPYNLIMNPRHTGGCSLPMRATQETRIRS